MDGISEPNWRLRDLATLDSSTPIHVIWQDSTLLRLNQPIGDQEGPDASTYGVYYIFQHQSLRIVPCKQSRGNRGETGY